MRAKNGPDMKRKRFEFHIFITSYNKSGSDSGKSNESTVVEDEIGFWGQPREDNRIDKVRAPFTDMDLYQAMKHPRGQTVLGDVCVWEG